MKNVFTTMVLALMVVTIGSAQIKPNRVKIPSKIDPKIDLTKTNSNLDLEKVKKHIQDGKYCYRLNATSTAIFKPQGRLVGAVDARLTHNGYVKTERAYLRTNGKLLRSDTNYNNARGNYYEVLIYPERNNPKKVDKNQVKITWRIPESQLRTFHLQNVSVRYKPNGILITGDYEVDGIVFGVCIALTPQTCLI